MIVAAEDVPFEIMVTHLDRYARVKIRGDLDYENVQSHADALRELGDLRREIVIDLTEVTFMDSGGLSVLVSIARHHQGPVRLQGVAPNIRQTLTVTGLEDLFETRDEGPPPK